MNFDVLAYLQRLNGYLRCRPVWRQVKTKHEIALFLFKSVFKVGHSRPFFFIFIFSIQLAVNNVQYKFCQFWTVSIWIWKQPFYQLSHHHCPSCLSILLVCSHHCIELVQPDLNWKVVCTSLDFKFSLEIVLELSHLIQNCKIFTIH